MNVDVTMLTWFEEGLSIMNTRKCVPHCCVCSVALVWYTQKKLIGFNFFIREKSEVLPAEHYVNSVHVMCVCREIFLILFVSEEIAHCMTLIISVYIYIYIYNEEDIFTSAIKNSPH